MKKPLLIIVIYLLFFACLTETKAKSLKRYKDAKVTRVISVHDGDTFRCNIEGYPPIIGDNIPVRIKGIDTPELRDKRKDVKELAHKAKDFTTKKLQTAKIIKLRNIERGKYFWILADVEVDGENLGGMLLDKGLANPCHGQSKAAWDTTKKTTPDFGNSIVYRGKKRTPKWFDRMYEKFYDKIIYWNGKYTDFGEHLADFPALDSGHMVWPIGSPVGFYYNSTVLSVLGNGEVLISNDSNYGKNLILHIHGLKGSFVVNQDFPRNLRSRLIYTGVFEYTAANQRHMTVPSLASYQPLTKEQFAEVINNGIELVEYERVIKDNRGRIYRKSDYDFSSDLYGNLTIQKGNRTVKKLPKGEYNYEVIGKLIR